LFFIVLLAAALAEPVMAEGAFICGRERREGGAIIFCCGLAR
jgi:hypothetical protein